MNYFYSTRLYKASNILLTSYKNKKDVEKWGAGGKIENDLYRINLETGKIDQGANATGSVLRSIIINKGEIVPVNGSNDGFSVYVKENGRWFKVSSFPTYGNANTEMKRLAPAYESVAVIEEAEREYSLSSNETIDLSILNL